MSTVAPEHLRRRSDVRSLVVVVAHLTVVVAPVFVVAARPSLGALFLAWLWYGAAMNGVVNLLHECAHGLVFSDKDRSFALGRRVIAPLVFTHFDEYRARHWDHHRFLGVDGETKVAYAVDVRGLRLLGLVARALVGVEALRRFRRQTGERQKSDDADRSFAWLLRSIVVHGALFCLLVVAAALPRIALVDEDAPLLAGQEILAVVLTALVVHAVVFVHALMSVTILLAALRAIVEHQPLDDDAPRVGSAALRNLRCNVVTRFFFGAYGFGEHALHHRHPGVPSYALPRLLDEVARQEPALAATESYTQVLARAVRSPSDAKSSTTAA